MRYSAACHPTWWFSDQNCIGPSHPAKMGHGQKDCIEQANPLGLPLFSAGTWLWDEEGQFPQFSTFLALSTLSTSSIFFPNGHLAERRRGEGWSQRKSPRLWQPGGVMESPSTFWAKSANDTLNHPIYPSISEYFHFCEHIQKQVFTCVGANQW